MALLADRYRIGAPVGLGGTAEVRRGFDRTLRRSVAIKLQRTPTTDAADRMLVEARTAALLNHPNVAGIYDYGETYADTGKQRFLVMEFVPGGTLADRVTKSGPMSLADAAAVGADVAAALAAGHELGIVHRDVKPRNVLLGAAGAKLVDFGAAAPSGSRTVDAGGRIWGTPLYIAPEQLRGEPSRPSADLFALGVLLYVCLTGASPWLGSSLEEVLDNRRLKPVPTLPRPQDFPPAFVKFWNRCVSPVPSKRPTAREALLALRDFAGARSRPSMRGARSSSARRRPTFGPRSVVAVCLGVILLVALLVAEGGASSAGHEPNRQAAAVAAHDTGFPPNDYRVRDRPVSAASGASGAS